MKRIVLTLCVFIALVTAANARMIYKCVDSDGGILFTDNPPPDAKCELWRTGKDYTPTPPEKVKKYNAEKHRKYSQEEINHYQQRQKQRIRVMNDRIHDLKSDLKKKEKALRDSASGPLPRDLHALQKKAIEIAIKKGEVNRAQELLMREMKNQNPNISKYDDDYENKFKSLNRKIDDLDFELRQEKFDRQIDKITK